MFHKFEIVDQKQISQGELTMRDNEWRILEDADCLTVTEEIFQASYFKKISPHSSNHFTPDLSCLDERREVPEHSPVVCV